MVLALPNLSTLNIAAPKRSRSAGDGRDKEALFEDVVYRLLGDDEDPAAAPNPIPDTRMVAVEPNPYREFHHAWMLDPFDEALFKRIAECQEGADGEDSTFLDLHFFPDSCLVDWSERADDRYGYNTLTASYVALSNNGTFGLGDEWKDQEPGFYAAAYASLWRVQQGIPLDEEVGEDTWSTGAPGILGGGPDKPYLNDWIVSKEDHATIMRVADDPEMWEDYYSDFCPFPDHRYPPALVPYMEGYSYRPSPMLKTDGDEMLKASTRAKASCPFWIPRVVMSGMTPEIAWTPHGNTPRERLQSLLKCITNAELDLYQSTPRLWPRYRLQDLSIVGTYKAYDAFASWWRLKKLDELSKDCP